VLVLVLVLVLGPGGVLVPVLGSARARRGDRAVPVPSADDDDA
jgi:hypothetical protein